MAGKKQNLNIDRYIEQASIQELVEAQIDILPGLKAGDSRR